MIAKILKTCIEYPDCQMWKMLKGLTEKNWPLIAVWSIERKNDIEKCYYGCLSPKSLEKNLDKVGPESCGVAALLGKLKTLKFLHESGCEWDESTCEAAALYDKLDCLKYACESGCYSGFNTLICALTYENNSCLPYLWHQMTKTEMGNLEQNETLMFIKKTLHDMQEKKKKRLCHVYECMILSEFKSTIENLLKIWKEGEKNKKSKKTKTKKSTKKMTKLKLRNIKTMKRCQKIINLYKLPKVPKEKNSEK